ncbi:MAG: Dabb family protein [Limisphaerales bacterium]
MVSHIVIFWTDPLNPKATDELIAGAERYLKPIPGLLHFHVGRMVPSPRPVVEQSYQVALNTVFSSRDAREAYRAHPRHKQFEEEVLRKTYRKCVVYDFE